MGNWGDDVVTAMRQRRRERELEPIREGYAAAAEVSIGEIMKTLDRIEAKVDSGEKLSADEKVLRTELHALRLKIERALQDFWTDTYDN
ncbi:hypothetical protein Mlaev_00046 [Microbacterium laevaniformans]|uniref:Uncharacterized protein n=2 Tax=Microbacterium laevaniformans TaxID=36807 RepID=A0A150HI79_9MICO|nr:hypothetical protein Mlaev_00046 [Microbacterium laevaniformans]